MCADPPTAGLLVPLPKVKATNDAHLAFFEKNSVCTGTSNCRNSGAKHYEIVLSGWGNGAAPCAAAAAAAAPLPLPPPRLSPG